VERTSRWIGLGYGAFVALGIAVGTAVLPHRHVGLGAAPFVGAWRWPPGVGLALPIAVAGLVVALGPRAAEQLSPRLLPPAAGAAAVAWAVALAASDGWNRLTSPLATRFEYEPFAATIHHPGTFLRTFVDRASTYPIHVKGHAPGATLVPWALDQIGLRGAGWFAALVILGWGVAIGAVLVATRTVAGDEAARRAAPILVLLPGAVWAATSADALFAAVLAVALAVVVQPGAGAAVVGGVVFAAALLLTYGAATLLVVVAVALLGQRRPTHLVWFGLTVVAVLVGVDQLTGFWWLDGLRATRTAYWAGVASRRPAAYLVPLGNPTALAVAVGPAAVAALVHGLGRRRERARALVLPMAAVAAVAGADLSLLSKGEVERIWLPFAVWIAAAGAVGLRRPWLVAQAATGIAAQALIASTW
jgi:hypothetical protein